MSALSLVRENWTEVEVEEFGPASLHARVLAGAARRTAHPAARALALVATPRVARLARLMDYAAVILPRPRGASLTAFDLEACKAEVVTARGVVDHADAAVLYLHGGAFIACGLRTHRPLAVRISRATGLPVLNVAYRLFPTAKVRESVEDALSAYQHLLDCGVSADKIVVAGDSAGAHLSVSMLVAARDAGLPMPAAIVALSPFVDMGMEHKLRSPYADADPLLPPSGVARIIELVGGKGGLDGVASPVESDLTGLPPTLIQVGSTEILRVDAERLATNLARGGVPTRLQIWDQQIHVFQAIGGDFVPEAKVAIDEIGDFIRDNIKETR